MASTPGTSGTVAIERLLWVHGFSLQLKSVSRGMAHVARFEVLALRGRSGRLGRLYLALTASSAASSRSSTATSIPQLLLDGREPVRQAGSAWELCFASVGSRERVDGDPLVAQ